MPACRLIASVARATSLSLLVALLLAAAGLLLLHHHGMRLLSVQTDSMVPTFRRGDALITMPAKPISLYPGVVISYRSPKASQVIISHRLVAITNHKLITAGDALGSHDEPFDPGRLIGRPVAVLPGLGRILDFLHQPAGLISLVFTPAALIIGFELWRLQRQMRAVYYRAYVYNR